MPPYSIIIITFFYFDTLEGANILKSSSESLGQARVDGEVLFKKVIIECGTSPFSCLFELPN